MCIAWRFLFQLLTLNGRNYEKLETVDISGQKLRYYEVWTPT